MADIGARLKDIKNGISAEVALVAATKSRTVAEIQNAIDAGIEIIGENYVQEAAGKYDELGKRAEWHMIGHLQRNKVKEALRVFDCIQSVDSIRLAREIDKQCSRINKVMPVLIEINIAGEKTKYGINPEELPDMLKQIAEFPNLQVGGIMTMEPYSDDPENSRPYFKRMKQLFNEVKSLDIANLNMNILSMGMSNSYQVAVEEGSNMIRVGTKLFGPRQY